MPFTPKFADLVRNVATVTGTGPVTLGAAVNGFTSLVTAASMGEQFYYCIQGVDKPAEREVGRGTMQSDGKVARQAIAGGLTNFTTGAKTIALVAPAEWFAKLDLVSADAPLGAVSREALAARQGAAAILTEAGREGLFLWHASDLSAEVASDTAQGIYIAPVSAPTGASGAWVRRIEGPVDPRWFGISSANAGVANDAALAVMFATLRARSASVGYQSRACDPIRFPEGIFGNYILDKTPSRCRVSSKRNGNGIRSYQSGFPERGKGPRISRGASLASGRGMPPLWSNQCDQGCR